jgi:hypothetical protein
LPSSTVMRADEIRLTFFSTCTEKILKVSGTEDPLTLTVKVAREPDEWEGDGIGKEYGCKINLGLCGRIPGFKDRFSVKSGCGMNLSVYKRL